MHAFFALSLLTICLAAVGHGLPCHIVGGSDASTRYPYMVSLRLNNQHFCGGSIIGRRYVLTAAHCLTLLINPEILKDVTVNAGTNFLNETGYAYEVEGVIIHPDFNMNSVHNDIGLLLLKTHITFNRIVQSISLVNNDTVTDREFCFLTGWGELQMSGRSPSKLQKLNTRVIPQFTCKLAWQDLQDTQICAFSVLGEGACYGDSGSPLVANRVQIGLASYVRPCAVGFPDVYTRVSAFKGWIDQMISDGPSWDK